MDAPAKSLKECAQAAYEPTLMPHHSWVMKKTVGAALMLLPAKEVFMKSLAGPEGGEHAPEFADKVRAFVASFGPLRAELGRFYKATGLDDGRLE